MDSGQDNQNPVSTQTLFFNKINTNLSDYTANDIFKLLEMKIDDYPDYESFETDADEKINKYVEIFEEYKNQKLINFFEEIRVSLFGQKNLNDNMT